MIGFLKTRSVGLTELLAKRKFGKAIELIREDLRARPNDPRLRLRLADTLIHAGRPEAAVPLLMELADDFALSGGSARAIALLKRAQSLKPGQPDVEERLAYLISRQASEAGDPWDKPKARPAAFEFDIEEITGDGMEMELSVGAEPPPAPLAPPVIVPPPVLPGATPPKPAAESDCAPASSVSSPADHDTAAGELSLDEFADEVMALVEDVLEGRAQPASAEMRSVPVVNTPLFRDFSAEELVLVIRGLHLRSYEPGEIVVSEGEPGNSLFVVTTGAARTYVRDATQRHAAVRVLHEGDFFGEVSLLENDERTATITAATRLELLEIDRPTLDEIAKSHPRIWDVIRRFYQERSGSDREVAARAGTAPVNGA